ncbi:MAG: ribosome maturation factor RimP [Calditrichota bacterium]|jgi:ribosome maturation factor RimP
MQEQLNQIRELINPVFERMHIHLVDLELRGHLNNQVLSVYADTDSGISLQEITDLTREIEDILDLENPIPGKYRLDVSSPGIDRPLKDIWQFRKNMGRKLQVDYLFEDTHKEIIGELKDVSDTEIFIKNKNKETKIPFVAIKKAVVKISW